MFDREKQTIAIVEQGTGGLLQAELSLALADQPYFSGGKVIGQLGTESGRLSEEADCIRQEPQADLGLAVSVLIKPESTEDNVLAKVYLTLATTSGISKRDRFRWLFVAIPSPACLFAGLGFCTKHFVK